MPKTYHLQLEEADLCGATLALLPGDPGRAELLARAYDTQACQIADHREYRTFLGWIDGQPVAVVSTGIGGSAAAIAVEELASLGVKTFIRVGTTGAIQPQIAVGDLIVVTGAVRLDSASLDYAPLEYPAIADHQVTATLLEAARQSGLPHHLGLAATSATFHAGQERLDPALRYVPPRFIGATAQWRRLGVLCYEMEAATILTLSAAAGLRAGCLLAVVVNRLHSAEVEPKLVPLAEQRAARVTALALPKLLAAMDAR